MRHLLLGGERLLKVLLAGFVLLGCMAASPSEAQTRRAFLIGNKNYKDGNIQQLQRTENDAKDLAKDLEQVGFDKKNIRVLINIKDKTAFDKEFDSFLKTIEVGDVVFFFFSGHGFGVEADQNNYLLFTDLKSPFAYAKSQATEQERRNPDVIRLRIPQYLESYQRDEIPLSGVAASEIERKLQEKRPKTVIMVLDACRSLVKAESDDDVNVRRGGTVGRRQEPTRNFLVLYSASFGEQAVESLSPIDPGRNSLFTEVFRAELLRPGQSLVDLAKRVKLMVRATAQDYGEQQEPEYAAAGNVDDFYLIDPIGRERFHTSKDKCAGEKDDWDKIDDLRKRDLLERHIRRFDGCSTAEFARRRLAELVLSADGPVEAPPISEEDRKRFDKCDLLAASDLDRDRPAGVPGLPFEKIAADEAIVACLAASKNNEFTPRFLFNLARAYHKRASDPEVSADLRRSALRSARLAYEDANRRGYKIALGHLAVLQETGDGQTTNLPEAIDLLKRGAEQEQEFAMYVLGVHYRYGIGVKRNFYEAFELFRRAGEKGYVPAKVEAGDALINRRPFWNPRRGVELLQEAASAGSTRAQFLLGLTYNRGAMARKANENAANQVRADSGLALLWFGRLAESGDVQAQAIMAESMQNGYGLSSSQPEASERYWRLAAQNGDATAQVTFADRLRRGFILVKQEYGTSEAIDLLKRAQAQGSPQAALALAQVYRNGELGQSKDAKEAVTHAFEAMELAVLSDQAPRPGEPFPEMAAAHMLAEMAKAGEAVDGAGGPLLTAEEVDRIERYYGKVDPSSKQVRIRRLVVPLTCGFGRQVLNRQTKEYEYEYQWTVRKAIWVWDWGRTESPTEFQFRAHERDTGCSRNDVMRRTLIDIYEQAKKNDVPYADLVEQKIKTAMGTYVEAPERKTRRRRGRYR
jgi:TPR repeat protein